MMSVSARQQSQYTTSEMLHQRGCTTLYRALRGDDRSPVVLKVLDPRRCRPKDLERLRHEYETGISLDLRSIVRPLALDAYEGMPALVFEDFCGQPLDSLLGAPMPVERFLDLAIRIAGAVGDLHRQGVIHKDLKPENILVHPSTMEVKLADLGLASRLPRVQQAARPPQLIEGTLPYMSPEQTGRMNRALDSRTDLYSLGVTFYQMLTGRLPFAAQDPLEWVHCHVARAPTPPSQLVPEVPEAIARVVLKLLAKMADDRYQTARGLQHDLARCLDQWRSQGRIDPFPLGERDRPDRPQIPQKLYGREEQSATLLRTFERVLDTGSPELLLVSGYPGIGKSSLVHELQKPIVRQQGLFVSGKFDQYARDAPYSTIVQAFREVVLDILIEDEEWIADWRHRLQTALGVNAQLIVDVIPQVELLIGKQSPIPELPPVEAQNRFTMVFRHFIAVFAQKDRPLALFLDDLQWADPASLALLLDLVTHPDMRYLLVVGAYRDNEVTPTHPFLLTLDAARKAGAHISDIVLGPLSAEDLAALVGDALHCGPLDAAPLAALVLEKTAANPFFAIHFLTALHEEGLIELDGRARAWRWDVEKIRARGFTDNVVDLMVRKLKRLPAVTQDALRQFACLGNSAEVAVLTLVLDCSDSKIDAVLWDALREGLILRAGDSYRFLHDRVHEAAYSLVPQESRLGAHLRIGRLLLSHLPQETIQERVFDVVGQLNRGADLITDPGEKESLRRLNFLAARKAKTAIAYASARSYLAQATALLPPDTWSARYDESFALYLTLSECEYLVGSFQSADGLFTLLLANARSVLDRASVYRLRMRLYQVAGRFEDAVTAAFDGLRLFGVVVPGSDLEIQAATEAERREVQVNLRGRRIAELGEAPVATAADVRTILSLIAEALSPVYNNCPHCYPLLTIRAVNFSLRYGNTEDSCFAYSCYASLLVSLFGDIPSAFEFSEMSLRLNEKLGDGKLRGALLFLHGTLVHFWRRHIATGAPILEQAFVACLDVGDLVFAGFNALGAIWQAVEKGDPLDEILKLSHKYIAFATQSHNDMVRQVVRLEEQFVASLRGRTRGLASFDDSSFVEAECLATLSDRGFGVGVTMYHVMKLFAAYTYGRYAEALEHALRAETMLGKVMAMAFEASYHFFHALTLAALHPQATAAQRRESESALGRDLQKLRLWSDNCPENFLNRYALVSAEVARIEGRDLDAQRLYEQAIRAAHENGFVQSEALAYELASKFYRARGFDLFADTYLREAHACYLRWGADGKARQLERLHPQLAERRPLAATATFAARTEQLDLLSVVKASQTVSGEILIEKLVGTLLEVLLQQGGARRGLLILARDGGLSIEAEATLDEKGVATRILPSAPVEASPLLPVSVAHYARLSREPVILDDAAAAEGKWASEPYFAGHGSRSVLCLPIVRRENLIGLLYLENDLIAGAFTANRLAALTLLASQAAISMENALLLSHERVSREAAERAERRSAFLAGAGALLSESLDYEETLARLGKLCVRSLADTCVLDLVEGGQIRRIASACADPVREPLLERLRERHPARWGSPHPAASCLRDGRPILIPEVTEEHLQSFFEDDEHRELARALGTRSLVAVPLVARGQTIGVLTMCSGTQRYGRPDLELVREVAHRAGLAIDNARLYRDAQGAIQALRESEERLRLAQDAAKAGTWEWDLRTNENFWSEGLWGLYGLEPHSREPSYEAWRQTIHSEDRTRAEQIVQDAARSGAELNVEWRVRSCDGDERWLMARGRPVRDADGRVVRYVGISMDITDRKRAEVALRQEDQRKSEFLGVLSHELRNPLAPIRTSIYILDRAPPSSQEAARAKEIIQRQTEHLSRLVDDLLDVTRISRGKIELRRERLDAREVVRRTSEDHRTLFEQSEIRLSIVLPPHPVWIDADATRISQAVGNLLQNAVKFTPAAGVVSVAVEGEGAAAVVRVRDSGLGIEQSLIEQVFEPFMQAKQSLARTRGGLGLGLALAKGLVDLHGGTVSAASEGLGLGSEFVIRLPLALQPRTRAVVTGARPTPVVRSVLIIEDNADAGHSLADVMELSGHRARVARDGKSGIALAREMRPDVILCDIGLPDIDGYEIARTLRTYEALRSTRIIALSGYAQHEDKERAKEAGFDAHLRKPPPLDELQELLDGSESD